MNLKKFFTATSYDLLNRARFGHEAPTSRERLWISPSVDTIYVGKLKSNGQKSQGSKVITSSWPFKKDKPFAESGKLKICCKRWVDGMSWEDAGAYKWMEKAILKGSKIDGCRSREDVIERYNLLDCVYANARRDQKFREGFYVNIHIGPAGTLYFGHGGGAHRLAIAYILGLPVQARICLLHIKGFPRLRELRQRTRHFV